MPAVAALRSDLVVYKVECCFGHQLRSLWLCSFSFHSTCAGYMVRQFTRIKVCCSVYMLEGLWNVQVFFCFSFFPEEFWCWKVT